MGVLSVSNFSAWVSVAHAILDLDSRNLPSRLTRRTTSEWLHSQFVRTFLVQNINFSEDCRRAETFCDLKMGASSLNRAQVDKFQAVLDKAEKITVLTGAGVSAESGIPTFRGEGGLWRTWSAMELATPEAFKKNPSLVWEFYHYRRCVVDKAKPNAAHYALTALQQRCKEKGKEFTLLTQNIDELHMRAGTEDVVELHGSLWKTRCTQCRDVQENRDMPICAALDGRGAPDHATPDARIPLKDLPRCKLCTGLLRPHVVWFGENLFMKTLDQADDALHDCQLLLVAGTSAVVWPAAGYAPLVSENGGAVAEFNIMETPASGSCKFKFQGPSAATLPEVLGIPLDQLPGDSTTDNSSGS